MRLAGGGGLLGVAAVWHGGEELTAAPFAWLLPHASCSHSGSEPLATLKTQSLQAHEKERGGGSGRRSCSR